LRYCSPKKSGASTGTIFCRVSPEVHPEVWHLHARKCAASALENKHCSMNKREGSWKPIFSVELVSMRPRSISDAAQCPARRQCAVNDHLSTAKMAANALAVTLRRLGNCGHPQKSQQLRLPFNALSQLCPSPFNSGLLRSTSQSTEVLRPTAYYM